MEENSDEACKTYAEELQCGCDSPNVKKGEIKATQKVGPLEITKTFTALCCLNCGKIKDVGPAPGGASYFPGSSGAYLTTRGLPP